MEDRILYSNKEYGKILEKYKDMKERDLNEWQLYWIAKVYYAQKDFDNFFKIYKSYIEKAPEENILKIHELWSYYYKYIKDSSAGSEIKMKYAKYILDNCEMSPDVVTEYTSIYNNTSEKIIENIIKDKRGIDYENLYNWTSFINPKYLSSIEGRVKKPDGEIKRTESTKELWYNARSKAAFELKRYKECIRVCTEGLALFREKAPKKDNPEKIVLKTTLHDNNHFLFKRRTALSERALGNLSEAERMLIGMLNSRRFKFLAASDLGDLYYEELQDKENAAKCYYTALLCNKNLSKVLISSMERIAEMLYEQEKLYESKLNYMLIYNLCSQNEWNIKDIVSERLNELEKIKCDVSETEIFDACVKVWQKEIQKYMD